MNIFFPGLLKHYGPNHTVDIELQVVKVTNFASKENDKTVSFDTDLAMKFWVNDVNATKECAVDITLEALEVNGSAYIHDKDRFSLNLTELHVDTIEVVSTTFGNLNLTLLAQLLNEGADVVIPYIDKWLLATFSVKIPTEIFGLFELSDMALQYHNDYIEIGATPTFLPPNTTYEVPLPFEVAYPEDY